MGATCCEWAEPRHVKKVNYVVCWVRSFMEPQWGFDCHHYIEPYWLLVCFWTLT